MVDKYNCQESCMVLYCIGIKFDDDEATASKACEYYIYIQNMFYLQLHVEMLGIGKTVAEKSRKTSI